MVSLWRSWKKQAPQPYRLARLVDARHREAPGGGGLHIICDIDKTYLETEFESLLRMARIAFEAAVDKVTVTGASEVLLSARWGDVAAPLPPGALLPHPLHFVSSSPPQLRSVLEEKMALDGLDWSSDTFKNQAYNLRMGRMDLLRQHVAYKSQAILNLVATAGPGAQFFMIGDNAESDAYIYTGIRLLLAGELSPAGYQGYLEAAGVEGAVAADLAAPPAGGYAARVAAILIRNVPGYVFAAAPPLTGPVQTFDNFYEAALLLTAQGLIPVSRLWPLTRSFHNHHGMTRRELGSMLRAAAAPAPPAAAATPPRQALAAAALAALAQLGREAEAAEPMAALTRSLEVCGTAYPAPPEEEIVAEARLWMQRLHGQKVKPGT